MCQPAISDGRSGSLSHSGLNQLNASVPLMHCSHLWSFFYCGPSRGLEETEADGFILSVGVEVEAKV